MTSPSQARPEPDFYRSMRDQILASELPSRRRGAASLRSPQVVLGGATAGLAAVIAAVVLLVSAGASAPPAFAFIHRPDGSVTLVIRRLSHNIPALNARLKTLGIAETVIPITDGCTAPESEVGPGPGGRFNGAIRLTFKTGAAALKDPAYPGMAYVLAAKEIRPGTFITFIGQLKTPLPQCLPYNPVPSS